jgi:hypothetical protein
MKPKAALVILSLAIALVTLLLIFENPFSSREGKLERGMAIEKVKLFTDVTPDTVSRIDVSRFDGRSSATLLKVDGVWYANTAKKHAADAKAVAAIFSAIEHAHEGEVVSRNPENQPKYGVSGMLAVHVKFYGEKGNVLEDVFLGRGGASDFMSSYVLREGSKNVLRVASMLPMLFERGGEDAWREHTILDYPPDEIIALTINDKNERYRLLKYASGDWELADLSASQAGPKKEPVDRAAAEQVSRTFAQLRASGFEDNEAAKPLSDFGLEKPPVIVTASLKDYSTTPVLYIGKESPTAKGRYFAKRPDRDQIYLIAQYQFDAFTKKPAELLQKPEANEPCAAKPASEGKLEKVKSTPKLTKPASVKKTKPPATESKKQTQKESTKKEPPPLSSPE